jgi:hypothetical protein
MRHAHVDQPTVITSLPDSPDAEYDHRRKRYAIMMGSRALCVIGAAATYHLSLWIAFAFVLAGTVLPWCAVILANDGPPRRATVPPPRRPNTIRPARRPNGCVGALPGSTDRTIHS